MTSLVNPHALVQGAATHHPKEEIIYVGFNQDQGCFAVGTSHGVRVFNTFPFKDIFFRGNTSPPPLTIPEIEGGVGLAELLYRTNMIALVGTGRNPNWPVNKVFLWDDSKLEVIGELTFKTVVRGIKIVKDKYSLPL